MPVIMLFQAAIMATNAACLSIVSQYIGARAYKNASLEASRFFTVSFLCRALLNILLLTLRSQIFIWLIFTPPEIFEEVMAFSAITAFDVFFNSTAFTFATFFRHFASKRGGY